MADSEITRPAASGDNVKVHYRGTLDDGSEFDTSVGNDPLEFRLGTRQIIAGFNDTVTGMRPGETRTARLAPEDAYGTRRDDLMIELPRSQFPEDLTPEVGQQLELLQEDDQRVPVIITAVAEDTVTLDANHPLAGKALTFEIELVAIENPGETP